jgi:hypothetical protein
MLLNRSHVHSYVQAHVHSHVQVHPPIFELIALLFHFVNAWCTLIHNKMFSEVSDVQISDTHLTFRVPPLSSAFIRNGGEWVFGRKSQAR